MVTKIFEDEFGGGVEYFYNDDEIFQNPLKIELHMDIEGNLSCSITTLNEKIKIEQEFIETPSIDTDNITTLQTSPLICGINIPGIRINIEDYNLDVDIDKDIIIGTKEGQYDYVLIKVTNDSP